MQAFRNLTMKWPAPPASGRLPSCRTASVWPPHAPTRAMALPLAAGAMRSLRDALGMQVRVCAGQVLLTARDLPADIELGAGAAFTVPNDGLVLIEAIGAARVVVEPQPRAQLAAGGAMRPAWLRQASAALSGSLQRFRARAWRR